MSRHGIEESCGARRRSWAAAARAIRALGRHGIDQAARAIRAMGRHGIEQSGGAAAAARAIRASGRHGMKQSDPSLGPTWDGAERRCCDAGGHGLQLVERSEPGADNMGWSGAAVLRRRRSWAAAARAIRALRGHGMEQSGSAVKPDLVGHMAADFTTTSFHTPGL